MMQIARDTQLIQDEAAVAPLSLSDHREAQGHLADIAEEYRRSGASSEATNNVVESAASAFGDLAIGIVGLRIARDELGEKPQPKPNLSIHQADLTLGDAATLSISQQSEIVASVNSESFNIRPFQNIEELGTDNNLGIRSERFVLPITVMSASAPLDTSLEAAVATQAATRAALEDQFDLSSMSLFPARETGVVLPQTVTPMVVAEVPDMNQSFSISDHHRDVYLASPTLSPTAAIAA